MVFLRDLIFNLAFSLIALIKVIFVSSWKVKIPKKKEESDELYVLCNGPSLKESFNEHFELLKQKTLLAVNFFAYSEKYAQLKPAYYVLNAPEFWLEKPPTQNHKDSRERLFKIILEQTAWNLVIFVPAEAKRSSVWKGLFDSNKNIKIVYYNNTGVEGFEGLVFKLMDMQLAMPRPHNVLTPSIYLGLQLGFKKLILFGTDHSWHEELRLDENNVLIVNHEHFYDQSKQYGPMHKLDGSKYKIHDVFRKLYLAFQSYFILEKYAERLGVKILNASKKSYIDAFEKIKL